MNVAINDWKNGWFGVEIAVAPSEIDQFIALLQAMKADHEQHFHVSSYYKGSGGVGDIEIFVKPTQTPNNASLSSVALEPGRDT